MWSEKKLFITGLVILFLSGCCIIALNIISSSRKNEITKSLTKSMWGFTPYVSLENQLTRQRIAYWKLQAAGEHIINFF
jgi:hypothetical protein